MEGGWVKAMDQKILNYRLDENGLFLWAGAPSIGTPVKAGDGNILKFKERGGCAGNESGSYQNMFVILNERNTILKPNTAYTFRIWGKGQFRQVSLWSNATRIISWPEGNDETTNGKLLGEFFDWHLNYGAWASRAISFKTESDTQTIMALVRSGYQLPQIGLVELYEVSGESEIEGYIAKGGKNLFPDPFFQEPPEFCWYNQWNWPWLERLPGNIGGALVPPILVDRDSFVDDLAEYGPFVWGLE